MKHQRPHVPEMARQDAPPIRIHEHRYAGMAGLYPGILDNGAFVSTSAPSIALFGRVTCSDVTDATWAEYHYSQQRD